MIDESFVRAIAERSNPFFANTKNGTEIIVAGNMVIDRVPPVNRVLHDHVAQSVELHQAKSLIGYVNTYKVESVTTLFADAMASSIIAALDYHKPEQAPATIPNTAGDAVVFPSVPAQEGYVEHRAILLVPLSEQWKRWTAIDGKELRQTEFAEFLEENYLDVAKPDHADLLEIVTNLQAKNDVAFSSKVNLQNGQTQFTYEEKIDGKGKGEITIPREIFLNIPVHFGGPAATVRVFFRYRVLNGNLSFTVKINRRELMVQEAFEAIVRTVEEGTGCRTVYGKMK